MNFSSTERNLSVDYKTQIHLRRMLNPHTGINKSIGFMNRSRFEPRIMTAGGELTGVHFLRDRPDPGPGFYHIGGSGIFLNEPLIRCLGESLERYSQFISDVLGPYSVEVRSHDEMESMGRTIIHPNKLVFFKNEQFLKERFPFKPFNTQMPIGWIDLESLVEKSSCWVPAQMVLVGYLGRKGEKKLNSSVTTGTAAHTDMWSAKRNALMELIQIDSVMGHWYSSSVAPLIKMDSRTEPITRLIERYFYPQEMNPQFYFLQNPDLPGFSIACVIRREGNIPRIGVGLGAGLRLNNALYSALLEAVGVIHMAKKAIIDNVSEDYMKKEDLKMEVNPNDIFDLDSNVVYYASDDNDKYINTKFSNDKSIDASKLAPDVVLDAKDEVNYLIEGFKTSKKELFGFDLTSKDLKQLGFFSYRVWSPDTLSLCLPSAPQTEHHRFKVYGGATNPMPHPYP